MSELQAHETVTPHFHGVSMFQLFIAGSGTIGNRGQELKPLCIQYKDHHTAYGPLVAGAQGLAFVALRMYTGNSAPVYLDKTGYRDKLLPSKRRNLFVDPVHFSIEPVMKSRSETVCETLLEADDGLKAQIVRLGAGMSMPGPDPSVAGGYYVFVGNGSLVHGAEDLPVWSMVVVQNTEDQFNILAGENGLEALVLQFPKEDI